MFWKKLLIYWQCKKGCILERKSVPSTESCVLGKPYALVLNTIGSTVVVVPNKSCEHNVIHPVLVKWFDNELKNENSIFHTCSIDGIFLSIKNETLYQAHPNYQSIGPWHDWVMVTFAEDGEDNTVEDVQQNDDR